MQVLDIIRKDNRTTEELNYSFNVLMNKDRTMTRFMKRIWINWNKILDNLQLVSKSRLHLFDWCLFKFKLQYILNYKIPLTRQIVKDGFNLHWLDEQFWNRGISCKDLLQTNNIYKTIYKNYIKFIPKSEFNEQSNFKRKFIETMINNFVQFETNRITAIFNEIGQTKEAIQNYAIPLFHELPVENWDLWLMGVIDRIDRATNEKLIFIDYKYGKSKYYYEKALDKSVINLELGFYAILPQGKNVYVVKNDGKNDYLINLKEVMGTKEVIPYYGAMLFFQDIQNTDFVFPIKSSTITNANKKINKYWNRFNTGFYQCKPNNSCYEWCDYYWDICKYNPNWIEIENSVKV